MGKNKKMTNLSIQSAGDFYDEHDLFEYGDVVEMTGLRFKLKRRKYIGVDLSLYSRLAELARQVHTTTEDLISTWLRQKLSRSTVVRNR